jgi:hypothetical protein
MGAITKGPAYRHMAKRLELLWIKPSDKMPDADIMVLVRVDQDDDESFATAAYWSGYYWGSAIGTGPVRHVRAWMHMHDALAALAKTRGEVPRG